MRMFFSRLRARLRNRSFDDDLLEELRVHEEMKREELLGAGVAADETRAAARRALGNITLMREDARRVWIAPWLESVIQDSRYAVRSFRRQPLQAIVMIVVLAFGIGLPATMFNLFKGIALDPWPVPGADEIVVARARATDGQGLAGPSVEEYRFLREHLTSMRGLAAHSRVGYSARLERNGDRAVALPAVWVSSNFFDVLGVRPSMGRAFVAGDDRLADDRSPLIISDAGWRRYFGRDPNVLGQHVRVGGHPFVVVGVLPRDFDGIGREVHLWMPLTIYAAMRGADDVAWEGERAAICCINVVGRLASGASRRSARQEVQLAHERFAKTLGRQPGRAEVYGTSEMSEPGGMGGGMAVVGAFSAAVVLIFVLACANVGNLQLARAFARKREIATRLSIGASRRRVVRQLLTEGFVLAALAGAVGIVIAALLPKIIFIAIDERPSEYLEARLVPDGEMIVFALLMCAAASVAFALMPALHATRVRIPLAALDRASTRRSRLPLRSILLATQIAACTALMAGAVLLTRAITHAMRFDPGFVVEGIDVVTPVFPSGTQMAHRRTTAAAVLQAMESVESRSVALAEINPFSDVRYVMWLSIPGASSLESVLRRNVSVQFFDVLGVQLRRGRMFDARVPSEAVVNEAFVRTYSPAEDIVGRTFDVVNPRREREGAVTVVGVVPDVHLTGFADVQPVVFTAATSGVFLTRAGAAAVERIRTTLASDGAGATVQPLRASIVQALQPSLVGAGMAWTLGVLGLALAAVGVFGVFAYAVEERRREIGVRLALGAARGHIVRMLVSTSGRAMAIGLVVGLLLSLACGPVLRSYLFGLHPLDPIAYTAVLTLLGGVALLATAIPARRAMCVDPAITLRED